MKKRIFSGIGIAGIIMLAVAAICVYFAVTDKNPVAGMLALALIYFGVDSTWFEINYAWTNGGLGERFKHWEKRRYWNKTRQIEHLRLMIQSDAHWMNHDLTVKTLSERYLNALKEDWYSYSFEHASVIRNKLKLDPISDVVTHVLVINCGDETMKTAMMIPSQWPNRDMEGIASHMFTTYKAMACHGDEDLRDKKWTYAIAKLDKF